ncbi:MAG: 1-acyl-sn-glycerol-3-phosphate acyltransferase [Vicingus serpentipes]|nr:1-acyl-sn-glycerol-3-phosphate acyltransferase [Vicingus serpentipes]
MLIFEDIRPYKDCEYKSAIKDLFEITPLMETVRNYLPELSIDEIKGLLLSFNGIQDFQSNMVCRVIQSSIDSSMDDFSHDGVDQLDKDKSYLLVTNHRDIVMDSALVNFCLNDRKHNTCEIAIGSNLLAEAWIEKLVKLNKSFIVKRNLPIQEMLEASKVLSSYINYTLKEKKQSIWIAQREGRAKDGFDKTNPGVLKMFALAAEGDLLDYLISLNIAPVSLSYELDPCDDVKTLELVSKLEGKEYVKSKGEDERSMMLGIMGQKGNVHLQFGSTINDEIEQFRDIKNRNQLLKSVAEVIDQRIYKNYRLWNSNYVAYDLLHSSNKYVAQYSENGKEKFIDYMNKKLERFAGNEQAKQLFLQMYANPVLNAETVELVR